MIELMNAKMSESVSEIPFDHSKISHSKKY